MTKNIILLTTVLLAGLSLLAQPLNKTKTFTRADTLRGSITPYRMGWDVLKYEINITPDIANKSITGSNTITYYEDQLVHTMQIDLQQPLIIDSIVGNNTSFKFKREGNICWVYLKDSLARYKIAPGIRSVTAYYHGTPREAKRAPWDGGLIWSKDSFENPFIGTACQGLGASVWFPCKDHQSDEPDSGMVIHIVAPDSLTAVSNGRLQSVSPSKAGNRTWSWAVKNPINSYDITMNIGKYTNFNDTLMGEGGKLDLSYWVLDYNIAKAKEQFKQVKPMLRAHEYWFGKYPFYEDSYKLIETPFLGMEHQSGVAYGNKYLNGYLGKDMSGTGQGLKWDFIIVHESGHEWFGNNITTKDIADMWVHEGFTNYSETLFMERAFSKSDAYEYCYGLRTGIQKDRPIIGKYGVNKEGSGDMYPKGANLLHSIRNAMNDDEKFRQVLRGLNADFYHKTVTTGQVEQYISNKSGIDFSKVFEQYLRTTQVPVLEYFVKKKKLYYRWNNCIKGFNLPLNVGQELTLKPVTAWQSFSAVKTYKVKDFAKEVDWNYYVRVKEITSK